MHTGVAVAINAYVRGNLTIAELERRLEPALLAEAGRAFVPTRWKPLPPCEHMYIEMTALGETGRRLLCQWCGEQRWEPF